MNKGKKISCLILDDDPSAIQQFKDAMGRCSEFSLQGSYSNANDFLVEAACCPVDILVLDIEMPNKSGLELAKEIEALNLPSELVFLSGFKKYAFDAIKVHPLSFLSKPVTPKDLKELAVLYYSRCLQVNEGASSQKVRFNTLYGFLLLDPNRIMAIQADGNYSRTIMDSGQAHLLTCTLKKIDMIVGKSQLVRISRSQMLNLKYLSFVDRKNQMCRLESDSHKMDIEVQKSGIKMLSNYLGEGN